MFEIIAVICIGIVVIEAIVFLISFIKDAYEDYQQNKFGECLLPGGAGMNPCNGIDVYKHGQILKCLECRRFKNYLEHKTGGYDYINERAAKDLKENVFDKQESEVTE